MVPPDDTRDRVLALLAENRGMTLDDLDAEARLLHDLGMDGDDAVEFFSMLQDEFATDLRSLKARWHDHFGGEYPPLAGWLAIAVAILAGVAAARLSGFDHPVLWAMVIAGVWLLAFRGRPLRGPKMIPITVRDVLASVAAGRWLMSYDEPVRRERKGIFWGGSS